MYANPIFHARTKHVELDLFFVRERPISGEIKIVHVPSSGQITDGLTKPLSKSMFLAFCSQLVVVDKNHQLQRG